MKTYKQKTDFLYIGNKLLQWYNINARVLPWRESNLAYNIWISEIILQQTQVKQGLQHYINFIERFPTVEKLYKAHQDEVLLYWKGLGYYSRAINLHKASQQVMEDFNGEFPDKFEQILSLRGVGKYTAAAIASICYGEKIPAVDGNFYRVFSRLFADNFDISSSKAFKYFSELALLVMPNDEPGHFNQAVMDLGSEICRPKNPDCPNCPLKDDCLSYQAGNPMDFPVKTKKVKVESLDLHYYFIQYNNQFIIKQRGEDLIWKKLFDFPESIPEELQQFIIKNDVLTHKLTHRNLTISIEKIKLPSDDKLKNLLNDENYILVNEEEADLKSFPKPLENYYKKQF